MSGHPLDDKLDVILTDGLKQAWGESQSRQAAPYDGIMGELPGWVPENFHREFHAIRGRLLETYSHGDLLNYLAEVKDTLNPDNPAYSRPLTPGKIWCDVSVLAQFQEAVELAERVRQEAERQLLAEGMEPAKAARKAEMRGQEAGLALLTDSEHAYAATTGKKFRAGRTPATGGPIRKWIEQQLSKNPTMKNRELWAAIKAKPPRGWQVMENRQGKYLDGPKTGNVAKNEMSYGRFSNVAKEERDKLKG